MKKIVLFLTSLIVLLNTLAVNSAQMGDLDMIPDFTLETQVSPKSKFKKTANKISLIDAVEDEDLGLVQKIFAETGDIEGQGLLNSTALMNAVTLNKSLEVIKFLVDHGADITRANSVGQDSIMIAIEEKNIKALVFLLSSLGNKKFEHDIYSQLINRLSLKSEEKFYDVTYRRMRYILNSFLTFKNEEQERLKKLTGQIQGVMENMPKELTNIIAGYAEPNFEECLGNSYENI